MYPSGVCYNKRKVSAAFCIIGLFILCCVFVRKDITGRQESLHGIVLSVDYFKELITKLTDQRNAMSSALNEMKKLYGQQNCKMLELRKLQNDVSQFGRWCPSASRAKRYKHVPDQNFAVALSKFLKNRTAVSFGDGSGEYKKLLYSFNEVINFTAFDRAPFCEEQTQGQVKFMDLTAPQYGLPIYDWVISTEVAQYIPEQFEDIYLSNLVRHAREGIILSWADPGLNNIKILSS